VHKSAVGHVETNSAVLSCDSWSIKEVSDWLTSVKLENLVSSFQSENVCGRGLREISLQTKSMNCFEFSKALREQIGSSVKFGDVLALFYVLKKFH